MTLMDIIQNEVFICLIASILAIIPILVLLYYNHDSKKIERFFYEHDRQKYLLLQMSVFILTVSFALNTRVITTFAMGQVMEYFQIYLTRK